jgi:GTP cyclohydrolase II
MTGVGHSPAEVIDCSLGLPLTGEWAGLELGAVRVELMGSDQDVECLLVYRNIQVRPLLVRLNSACFTSDIFGDARCDCRWQQREFLSTVLRTGSGLLVYLLHQEGRGNGLMAKLAAAANLELDEGAQRKFVDHRTYEVAVAALKHLHINDIVLATNNPLKTNYLKASGINVVRTASVRSGDPKYSGYYDRLRSEYGHLV